MLVFFLHPWLLPLVYTRQSYCHYANSCTHALDTKSHKKDALKVMRNNRFVEDGLFDDSLHLQTVHGLKHLGFYIRAMSVCTCVYTSIREYTNPSVAPRYGQSENDADILMMMKKLPELICSRYENKCICEARTTWVSIFLFNWTSQNRVFCTKYRSVNSQFSFERLYFRCLDNFHRTQ